MKKEDFMYVLPRRVVQEDGRYFVTPNFLWAKHPPQVLIPIDPEQDDPFTVLAICIVIEERYFRGCESPEDLSAFVDGFHAAVRKCGVAKAAIRSMAEGKAVSKGMTDRFLLWAENHSDYKPVLRETRLRHWQCYPDQYLGQ